MGRAEFDKHAENALKHDDLYAHLATAEALMTLAENMGRLAVAADRAATNLDRISQTLSQQRR